MQMKRILSAQISLISVFRVAINEIWKEFSLIKFPG